MAPSNQSVFQLVALPKESYCTLRFLQQCLQGVKTMQTAKEVPDSVHIPVWPELAVKKVWPHAIRLPGVAERLPDEWDGGTRTDKKFFWGTVLAQHDEWVSSLVNDCTRQRAERAAGRDLPRATI